MNNIARRFLPFLQWQSLLNRQTISQDLSAGLTGALLVLPQGAAYAMIAGLDPIFGLYTAIFAAAIAALFGSSWHLVSGPAAAISIIVASVTSQQTPFGAADYAATVFLLTLIVGVIQLLFGLLRLGFLVSFISHTVVLGFTAGAAIIIGLSQLKHVFGIAEFNLYQQFRTGFQGFEINNYTLLVATITIASAVIAKRIHKKSPYLLIGMILGSLANYLLDGVTQGVALVGALPEGIPSVTLPALNPELASNLIPGALAVALMGLIEAVSIAKSISLKSKQRLNANQEFVGQGLSNLIGSTLSCFVSSGSFTRSAANYDSGAQTPLAVIFASIFLASVVFFVPSLTAQLPLAAMGGVVMLIAWNLFDLQHIKETLHTSKSESVVLIVTFISTLAINLEFAIYIGVITSLILYLKRTSRPAVTQVSSAQLGGSRLVRNIERYQLKPCPQIQILRIDGSIFFAANDSIQTTIEQFMAHHPQLKQLIILGKGVNFIDPEGVKMLAGLIHLAESKEISVRLASFKGNVIDDLQRKGLLPLLGEERLSVHTSDAIKIMMNRRDMSVCEGCTIQCYNECKETPQCQYLS